jgi:hypothetical protein
MTGVCHHTQLLLVETEPHKLFVWAGLKLHSSKSPEASYRRRITGMSHFAWLVILLSETCFPHLEKEGNTLNGYQENEIRY